MQVIRFLLIILVMFAIGLVLNSCAPTVLQQIEADRAKAEVYQAQAGAVRAEGDAAVQKANATAITLQAMQNTHDQALAAQLIYLREASDIAIDNTFWCVVLIFVLLVICVAILVCQVLHMLRKMRATNAG